MLIAEAGVDDFERMPAGRHHDAIGFARAQPAIVFKDLHDHRRGNRHPTKGSLIHRHYQRRGLTSFNRHRALNGSGIAVDHHGMLSGRDRGNRHRRDAAGLTVDGDASTGWFGGHQQLTDVAATVGISRRFVYKWVKRVLEQGVEGLADKPGRGYRRVPRSAALADAPRKSA